MNRVLAIMAVLLMTGAAAPPAPIRLVRPIASFTLTLMPPGKGQKPFGWIELLDPTRKPSGYVYLEDSDDDPRLGGHDTYIVTHLPYSELAGLIAILQSVRPLQISYVGGDHPNVFIESSGPATPPTEVQNAISARRSQ